MQQGIGQVGEVDKIDLKALNTIHASAENSLGWLVQHINAAIHGTEIWYGKDGVDNYLSPTSMTRWQPQAGTSEAFGTPLQISNGDEIEGGDPDKHYDAHRIFATAVSALGKVYRIQFLYGTGVVGDATLLTEMLLFAPAVIKSGPIDTHAPGIDCNNKLWVKIACETDNATIDFLIGIHAE